MRALSSGLFLLVLLLLFSNLGSYGLLEDNEARFFDMSWEMLETGDWITPHLNFINHFHKPPLTFWLVGSSLKVFGASEWAGRLPIALVSLCLLGFVSQWGDRKPGHGSLWATLILITSIEYWFLSRLVLTDMVLALTVGSALYGFWRLRESSSRLWSLLFWLSLGLSFLTKGPVGLAIVGLTLLCYRLLGGNAAWRFLLRPEGPVLAALVACPWYIIESIRFKGLISYLLHFQTVDRVVTEVHGRGGPIWFYIPVILAGFFPWSPALWVAFRDGFKRREDKDLFLLAWILGPLLLFSLSGSKLPTYLLPLYPAFAMLLARSLDSPRSARSVAISCSVGLFVFSLALIMFLNLGLPPEIAPNLTTLIWVSVASGSGTVLSLYLCWTSRSKAAIASVGLSFATVLLLLGTGIGKSDAAYSARRLAEVLREQEAESIVVEFKDHLHGLPYYLKQRIVQISYPREIQFEQSRDYRRFLYDSPEEFLASLKPNQQVLVITRDSDLKLAETLFHSSEHIRVGNWEILKVRATDV